jgi:glycosyltransferase involved in cell wall biosynthesis
MKLSHKYFLYVGNAYPHKNLDHLVEAFTGLSRAGSTHQLVFVGPDDYFYKRLREKIRLLKLGDKIIFYGPASGQVLTNLYKNAIALVFPSLMEGFGLPALEAMANGCLVLCSDIPVFHEVLGKAALFFDPNNTTDIQDKMAAVIKQPERYGGLIKEGLSQARKYSWKNLARETLKIYQEVVQ